MGSEMDKKDCKPDWPGSVAKRLSSLAWVLLLAPTSLFKQVGNNGLSCFLRLVYRHTESHGGLVKSDQVQEFILKVITEHDETLEDIPSKLAKQLALAEDPAQCQELMEVEIRQAQMKFTKRLRTIAKNPR